MEHGGKQNAVVQRIGARWKWLVEGKAILSPDRAKPCGRNASVIGAADRPMQARSLGRQDQGDDVGQGWQTLTIPLLASFKAHHLGITCSALSVGTGG